MGHIENGLRDLFVWAIRGDYELLERDTLEIIYPSDEPPPLVADHRIFQERRVRRDTVLREALESRRRQLT